MLSPFAYRGCHEPAPIWLEDDSPKPPTDKERIEQLEDELRRERTVSEYWRLCFERLEAKLKEGAK